MNSLIEQALNYCRERDLGKFVLVAPMVLDAQTVDALRADNNVQSLFALPPGGNSRWRSDRWFTRYRTGKADWLAGGVSGSIIFMAGPALIPLAAALQFALFRRGELVCRVAGSLRRCTVFNLVAWRLASGLSDWLRHQPQTQPLVRLIFHLRRIDGLRRYWRRHFVAVGSTNAGDGAEGLNSIFREILESIETVSPAPRAASQIVHVTAGLSSGGAERQLCVTVSELAARGDSNLTVLTEFGARIPAFRPYAESLQHAGVSLRTVARCRIDDVFASLAPGVAAAMSQLPPALLADTLSLVAALRKEKPSVVHAWQDATNIRAGIAALIAGVPRVVLGARNVNPSTLPTFEVHLKPAYCALLQRPEISLVANSRAGAMSYSEWMDIDAGSISVIPNAFDRTSLARSASGDDLRRRLGITPESIVVGGVFRLVAQKRPVLWLETAACFAKQEAKAAFVIAGDGPMRQSIARHANRLDLRDNFYLLNAQNDIAAVYELFDAFLLTSEFEGMANVLLEAQFYGVPIVCCDVGGNREAVIPDGTALIVDEADVDSLSQALLKAVRDKAWRREARRIGKTHVSENFTPSRIADAYRRLYEGMNGPD